MLLILPSSAALRRGCLVVLNSATVVLAADQS